MGMGDTEFHWLNGRDILKITAKGRDGKLFLSHDCNNADTSFLHFLKSCHYFNVFGRASTCFEKKNNPLKGAVYGSSP